MLCLFRRSRKQIRKSCPNWIGLEESGMRAFLDSLMKNQNRALELVWYIGQGRRLDTEILALP